MSSEIWLADFSWRVRQFPWSSFNGAYGKCEAIADSIIQEARFFLGEEESGDCVECEYMHQGTVYDVTPFVIPFQVEILEHAKKDLQQWMFETWNIMVSQSFSDIVQVKEENECEQTSIKRRICLALKDAREILLKTFRSSDLATKNRIAALMAFLGALDDDFCAELVSEIINGFAGYDVSSMLIAVAGNELLKETLSSNASPIKSLIESARRSSVPQNRFAGIAMAIELRLEKLTPASVRELLTLIYCDCADNEDFELSQFVFYENAPEWVISEAAKFILVNGDDLPGSSAPSLASTALFIARKQSGVYKSDWIHVDHSLEISGPFFSLLKAIAQCSATRPDNFIWFPIFDPKNANQIFEKFLQNRVVERSGRYFILAENES
jgi:hypothetical protein